MQTCRQVLHSIPDPADQILGIPLQDLCFQGQGVLWPGKHLALYSEIKGQSNYQYFLFHDLTACHASGCAFVNCCWTVLTCRVALLLFFKLPTYWFILLFHVTIVLTMLLGQVSFPGRWRVVMHSQYLSMKGIISCGVNKIITAVHLFFAF